MSKLFTHPRRLWLVKKPAIKEKKDCVHMCEPVTKNNRSRSSARCATSESPCLLVTAKGLFSLLRTFQLIINRLDRSLSLFCSLFAPILSLSLSTIDQQDVGRWWHQSVLSRKAHHKKILCEKKKKNWLIQKNIANTNRRFPTTV